ncbi:MAG TPA: diguanylate cyclase [Thermoanaerobaculaceae bacterium]|nr:diguanylate cyclase [Thermoanaerobaculaceae bacterium]
MGSRSRPGRRLALGFALAAAAMPVLALDPALEVTQYRLQVWSGDQLPSPIITELLQTRDGFVWIGTPEGLARFDGSRFETFTPVTTDGVVPSYVTAMTEDATGVLWIGTANGLVRFWDGTFTHFSAHDGLPQDVVLSLAASGDGSIWIGTNGGGLCRLRDGRFTTLTTHDGLASDYPYVLQVDREGSLWIGHLQSVDRWRADRIEPVVPVGRLLGPGPDGEARVLTPDGPAAWRNGRFERLAGLPDGTTRALDDRDGNRWLAVSGRGLCRLANGRLACTALDRNVPALAEAAPIEVRALMEDRDGNLWAGTDRALICLSDPRVVPLGPPEGLPTGNVRTVVEDLAGRLWAGGADGLCAPDPNGWRLLTARDGLPSRRVTSLLAAHDGSIWVGTEAGVRIWRNGRLTPPPDPLARSRALVLDMMEDRSGAVWVSLRDEGLGMVRGDTMRVFTETDGLADRRIGAILADSSGSIWAGGTAGLNRLQGDRWTHWTTADGLAANYVLTLHEDRQGGLWIGSWGGLSRFSEGRLTAWAPRHGLPSDIVYQLLGDDRGNLWLGTPAGIFAAPIAELDAVANGTGARVEGRLLAEADGMRGRQCLGTTQPAGVRRRDGSLWFATTDGLVRVEPGRALQPEPAPAVVLKEIIVNGVTQQASRGVLIPPGRRSLEVTFMAPVFEAPERVRFRCRLVGFDEGWQDLGERHATIYTNLPPGRLRFEVAAAHGQSGWGTPAGFDVNVRALFRETWGFPVLLLVGAALATVTIVRWRLRTLERRRGELEALVAERTAQLAEANRELGRLASEDGLTRVANKRTFESFYADESRRAVRNHAPLSVILLDVDFFKRYNDRHGHLAGDECLRAVATVLRERVRRAGDLVARYGGEEFVVVLANADLEGALLVAEQLREGVELLALPHGASDVSPHVTISLGVASTVPEIGDDSRSLVAAADAMLYHAKAGGRNQVAGSTERRRA